MFLRVVRRLGRWLPYAALPYAAAFGFIAFLIPLPPRDGPVWRHIVMAAFGAILGAAWWTEKQQN